VKPFQPYAVEIFKEKDQRGKPSAPLDVTAPELLICPPGYLSVFQLLTCFL
jgi:hypothetical protein